MGFFFCPRLRRYGEASDSSDSVASYQLDRIESSSPTLELPEGISSSTDERSRHERLSTSSGGLSGRIRRRFSRDARDIYRQPKKSDRPAKIPFLHLPSKQPAASYDLGSSLMSERGYDSDAQYIATPKQPTYTTEHPANKSRNGLALSPRHLPPPSRGPSREMTGETTIGLTVAKRGMANEQPMYNPERGGSQSSWRSREHEQRPPQAAQESPSSFRNVDLGSPHGQPSNLGPSGGSHWAQERPAPLPLRVQEMHRQHIPIVPVRPTMPGGSFDDSMSRRSGPGHNTGVLGYPGHHGPQQQAYTTSADSLTGCPPQISVRKRHQRLRRELAPDEQSVHLGEMNISRMLASSGSTSHINPQTHPYDDTQSSSKMGTWNANRYQAANNPSAMPPTWNAPEESLTMQPNAVRNLRSPKASVSPMGYGVDELDFSHDSSGNIPSTRPGLPLQTKDAQSLNIEHASASAANESHALRSKFTEKFGSDRSVGPVGLDSHEDDAVGSPRKISIGWMSEGRRIGYGYALVPPENPSEEYCQTHCSPEKLENCGSMGNSPKGSLAGSITEHTGKQRSPLSGESNQGLAKASESSFDLSTILQKLNLSRWTGANFALRTSNNSDAGSCDSGGSSLLNILANRKKIHADTDFPSDADNPWEFCSWVRPVQSSNGQQVPQQDNVGSHEHAEAQLIEKLATLRRRGGAWATKRKVSEIARGLEKRADRAVAKLAASTDQFPVVQRTATRVLRLRGPGSKGRPDDMHDSDPIFSANQFDVLHNLQGSRVRPSDRTSSGTSDDWDSLYEECLEERSIPE